MAQKKTYRLLTLAVMAMVLTALFALTAFAADITGGFGTIILPDDGNAYEAASVTINKTGDGANIDEENIIDLSTDNEKLAGLYAVRVKDGEWNDEYVYVYGVLADRKSIYENVTEGDKLPTGAAIDAKYVGHTKVYGENEYHPGFVTGTGSWGYYDWKDGTVSSHNSSIDSNFSAKSTALYNHTWQSAIEEFEAKTAATTAEKKKVTDQLTKEGITTESENYQKRYDEIYAGIVAGYRAKLDAFYAKYYSAEDKTAFIDADAEAKWIADREKELSAITTKAASLKVSYALTPAEIVPVSELVSYAFQSNMRQTIVKSNENIYAKFVARIADKNGDISTYTYTTNSALMTVSTTQTVDFKAAAKWVNEKGVAGALPEEGYLVAFDIYPFATMSDIEALYSNINMYAVYSAPYASISYFFGKVSASPYTIETPKALAPVGVIVEGTTFKNLDADTTYYVAPLNVNGIDSTATPIEGVTEFDVAANIADAVGLYGIYFKGDGVENVDSAPVVLYIRAPYAQLHDIGTFDEGSTKAKSGEWRNKAAFDIGLFRGFHVSSAATSPILNGYQFLNDWAYDVYPNTYHAALLSEDTSDDAAALEDLKSQFRKIQLWYAYTPDEIVSVDMLEEMNFRAYKKADTGHPLSLTAQPLLEIYVMDKNGKIRAYSQLGARYESIRSNPSMYNTPNIKFDIQSFDNLPAEGWVVGFKYYPFYEFGWYDVTSADTASTKSHFANFIWIGAKENYVVGRPPVETPTDITLENGVISGLKDGYAVAQYTVNGVDVENAVTSENFVDGTYTLPKDAVGLYAVYKISTSDEYENSVPVLLYVRGNYSVRADLGEVSTHGENTLYDQVNISSEETFVQGYFNGNGQWSNYNWGLKYRISTTGTHYGGTPHNAFYNATTDAEKIINFNKISNAVTGVYLQYALTDAEIVPISEVNTYKYSVFVNQGNMIYTDLTVKYDAYVVGASGEVEVYSYLHSPITLSGSSSTLTVDFTGDSANGEWIDELPTDGYFLGFRIWPYYGMTDWTDFTATALNTSTVVYGTRIAVDHVPSGYSIVMPKAEKPTGVTIDGSVISGLKADYAIASYTMAGIDAESIVTSENFVEGTYTLPEGSAGFYAVFVPEVEGVSGASDTVLFYVKGDYEARAALMETYTHEKENSDGTITYIENVLSSKYGISNLVPGYVTADHSFYNKATANVDLTNYYGTTAQEAFTWSRLKGIANAENNEDKKTAFETLEAALKGRKYNYTYTAAEIVPVKDVIKYTYGINFAALYYGNFNKFKLSNFTAKFDAHLMNKDGEIETYSYVTSGLTAGQNLNAFVTVDFMDDSKWSKPLPDTDYLVGFSIYPFDDLGEVDDLYFEYKADFENLAADNVREIMYFGHGETKYALIDSLITPVVEKNNYIPNWDQSQTTRFTNEFNLVNYSDMFEYEYAYGDDDVTVPTEGWTALDSTTIKSTKNSKYVWVRRLAGGGFEAAAAASDLPSEAVAVEGIQLVLGGNIGAKVVFNYNTDIVSGGHVYVNPDTPSTAAGLGTAEKHLFVLDGEGMGYAIVPFLPKEAEALVYENEIIYYTVDDISVNMSNVGGNISVAKTVEAYQNNADKYADVIDLVNALETYYKAAADYFDGVAADENTVALADLSTEELADLASKRARRRAEADDIADTLGLSFHSTSLLLEDNTTIRHYFKVTGSEASTNEQVEEALALYKVEGGSELALATSTGDAKYVYTDVAGIASNALSTPSDVTVMFDDAAAGDASITVTFSALDYVDLCINDADVELQNLVKALYRYSVESDNYNA